MLPSPTFSRLQIKRKGIISNASFRFACTRFWFKRKTHAHIILCSVLPPFQHLPVYYHWCGACHHSCAPSLDVDSLSSLRMDCVSLVDRTHTYRARRTHCGFKHIPRRSQQSAQVFFFELHKILVYAGTGIAHVTVSLSLILLDIREANFTLISGSFVFSRVPQHRKCRRKINIHTGGTIAASHDRCLFRLFIVSRTNMYVCTLAAVERLVMVRW